MKTKPKPRTEKQERPRLGGHSLWVTEHQLHEELGIPYGRKMLGKLEDRADNPFPRRKRLGNQTLVWSRLEVLEWMEREMAAREPQGRAA